MATTMTKWEMCNDGEKFSLSFSYHGVGVIEARSDIKGLRKEHEMAHLRDESSLLFFYL